MAAKQKNEDTDRTLTESVEAHRGRLSSLIRSMVRDDDEADDILQDVFEEFVEAYQLGSAIETIGGWLARVARNKVIDRFRRKKVHREYEFLVQSHSQPPTTGAPLSQPLLQTIGEALERLSPEQRDVFVKHELEGKSFEEIAAETGVALNTLLSRKRYAVRALRGYLKEVYDELE